MTSTATNRATNGTTGRQGCDLSGRALRADLRGMSLEDRTTTHRRLQALVCGDSYGSNGGIVNPKSSLLAPRPTHNKPPSVMVRTSAA